MPFLYTLTPRKIHKLAMWPLAMASGGSVGIPARSLPDLAGEGHGIDEGLTYDRFEGLEGSEGVLARGSMVPDSGGRCELTSGEVVARPGQQVAWEAAVGNYGGDGVLKTASWEASGGMRGSACVKSGGVL
jgi:hypothetical protein